MQRDSLAYRHLLNDQRRYVGERQPSWVLKGLILPFVMWLILNTFQLFQMPLIRESSIAIGIIGIYAVSLYVLLRVIARRNIPRKKRIHHKILIYLQYNSVMVLVLATFLLRTAIEINRISFGASLPITIALYLGAIGTLLFSSYWAPRSLVSDQEQLHQMEERQSNWMPSTLAIQGTIFSAGILLGAVILHSNSELWASMLLATLSLASFLLFGLSVLGIFRFFVLSIKPSYE